MKNPWLLMLLALAVAGVAVFFVVWLWFGYLMRSLPPVVETAMVVSLAVIVIGLCAALITAWWPAPSWRYRVALVVMLLAGIAPAIVDLTRAKIEEANESAERRALETKFLSRFEAYKTDVAARLAAQKPFVPREAQDFLEFVQESNLGYRNLPDHSLAAFALLEQALDAKILDPNVRVKGKRAVDVGEEPLFVVYYKFYLQSGVGMKEVREREWMLWQMLIAGGADLNDPAAAILKDQVARETEPHEFTGFLKLK